MTTIFNTYSKDKIDKLTTLDESTLKRDATTNAISVQDDSITSSKIADGAINSGAMFTDGAKFSSSSIGVVPSFGSSTNQILSQEGWVLGLTYEPISEE